MEGETRSAFKALYACALCGFKDVKGIYLEAEGQRSRLDLGMLIQCSSAILISTSTSAALEELLIIAIFGFVLFCLLIRSI